MHRSGSDTGSCDGADYYVTTSSCISKRSAPAY
jgi:hypothetical protein